MYKPNIGDIVIIKGQSFISQVISEITDSPYSHCAIVVKKNEIVEAQGFRKVGFQGLDYYKGISDIYTCEELSKRERHAIAQFALDQVGKNYDYMLLVWELIRIGFGYILPYKNTPSYICSELVRDSVLKGSGIDLTPNIKYPTPNEISKSSSLRYIGGY